MIHYSTAVSYKLNLQIMIHWYVKLQQLTLL
jgi:hypothetical protein